MVYFRFMRTVVVCVSSLLGWAKPHSAPDDQVAQGAADKGFGGNVGVSFDALRVPVYRVLLE